MKSETCSCVVCGEVSKPLFAWSGHDIRREYGKLADQGFPGKIQCADYTIMQCGGCGLVFADPPIPGDGPFYAWVTSLDNYYQEFRWEWKKVREILEESQAKSLLEVGCGTGNFLKYVSSELGLEATGLDTHAPSVEACRRQGLNVECMSLGDFADSGQAKAFDAICAFHCLEHVPDPKGLVASMGRLLSPGGRLILSVPYSPVSVEAARPACMNLPPHHLTRWNQKAIRALAKATGMAVEVQSEEGVLKPALWKSIYWLFRETVGVSANASFPHAAMVAMLNPAVFLRCLSFGLFRDRINGRPAGDIALAILRPNTK